MPVLSYAGIPLVHDFRREAAGFLERYQELANRVLHGEFPFSSSWQSNPNGAETNIGLPVVNWPKGPPLRLNQLYWPVTGASRWAEGLFLCTGAQVTAIDSCATSSAGAALVWSDSTNATPDSLLGTDDRGISWAEMWPVNYHRVSGCQTGQELDPENILPNSTTHDYDLYLVHLVDRRWWWQFIDAPDVCEHLTSWQDLIDYLCGQLGIVAFFDPADLPLPAIYTTLGPHPSEWVRPYHNAAQLLDAALESIGARLVAAVDVLTGGPSIWKLHRVTGAEAIFQHNTANARVGFTNLRDQLAGTDCQQARSRAMPAYVRTLFPKSRYGMLCGTCSTTTPTSTSDDSEEDCHESYHVVTHSLQEYLDPYTYCPVQSTAKTIHIRGWADMGQCADSDPMNNVELVALANQVASDWFLYHRRQYDFTTVGPTAWDPCGYDDSIIHCFGVEYQEGLRGIAAAPSDDPRARDIVSDVILEPQYRRDITSRIQSLPLNVGSDCQLHATKALELPGHLLVKMNEAVPAFECNNQESEGEGEPGQVCGALGVAYRLVGELGCECLTPQKVTAIDSEHEGEDYLVWVYNTDCNEIAAGECVDTGPFRCCARRALVRCQTGSTLAVAIDCIVPGSTTGTATLENGAVVTIDNSDCLVMALPGDTFPVVYGGCAPSCTWRPAGQFGTTRWVRVWNTMANSVSDTSELCPGALGCCEARDAYVLEDATDAEESGAEASSGGGPGCCTKRETECQITVCNTTNRKIAPDCFYEDLLATLIPGKTCLWYLHDARRAQRLQGTLITKMCGNDEEIKVVNVWIQDVCDWEPPTEPLVVSNPYLLLGCESDLVELTWNERGCVWDVTQVSHHFIPNMLVGIRCDPDECNVKQTKTISGLAIQQCESCGETQETVAISGGFVDIVTGGGAEGGTASSVLTGVDCSTGSCGIEFTNAAMTPTSLSLTRIRVCILCAGSEPDPDPIPLGTFAAIGAEGQGASIPGAEIEVPSSIVAVWSDGSGGSGGDCETSPSVGSTLMLSMTTTKVCILCPTGGEGGTEEGNGPGTPIDFPLAFTRIEPVVGADFDCTGCPSLTVSTQGMFALCVDAAPAEGDPVTCDCDPCTSGGS
jgi:hypothetical protein